MSYVEYRIIDMKNEMTTVQVTKEMHSRLRLQAARERISITKLTDRLLEKYLSKLEKKA